MSIEGRNIEIIVGRASAAIAENTLVKIDTSYTAGPDIGVAPCGAGDAVLGVAADAASAAGDEIRVVVHGYGKLVKLGGTPGTVVLGGRVKADSAGEAILAATALDYTAGVCLAPVSTTATHLIPIIVQPFSSVLAAS